MHIAFISAILIVSIACNAAVSVSNLKIFQVIQRTSAQSANYALNGTCGTTTSDIHIRVKQQASGTTVAGFDWKSVEATVQGSSWTGTIKDIPVGGEYSIEFQGVNSSGGAVEAGPTIEHVLVGDIFVASGQSNIGGLSEAPIDEHVHYLYTDSWEQTQHNLSVSFGKTLYENSGVPVGITTIVGSGAGIFWWGPGQAWLEPVLGAFNYLKDQVAGFIWYQGETDSEEDQTGGTGNQRAFEYQSNLQALINTVRGYSAKPDLAVLIVQVGSLYPAGAILVRGAQYDIAKNDPRIATIPVWDLGGDLHLSAANLDIAGARLAYAYMRKILGMETQWYGPQFSQAWFSDSEKKRIAVQFTDVKESLAGFSRDPERYGFFILDTAVWRQNNYALSFDYGTAGLLKEIDTITLSTPDQLCIELTSAATAPVTLSYGRVGFPGIMNMDFVSDGSGVRMATLWGYPVLDEPVHAPAGDNAWKNCKALPNSRKFVRKFIHDRAANSDKMKNIHSIYSIDGRRCASGKPLQAQKIYIYATE